MAFSSATESDALRSANPLSFLTNALAIECPYRLGTRDYIDGCCSRLFVYVVVFFAPSASAVLSPTASAGTGELIAVSSDRLDKGASTLMNDIDAPSRDGIPSPADAYGHAALLLIESLIHGLCEKAVLSTRDAINIAESAVSVQSDIADAAGASGASMNHAHGLLVAIANSLRVDDVDQEPG